MGQCETLTVSKRLGQLMGYSFTDLGAEGCCRSLNAFLTMYHHEISRSCYHWQKWCPCKRSRSKVMVTEVKTQFSRFWTVSRFWIHIWRWNDAQSLMSHRRGAPLFSRSSVKFQGHLGQKIANFDLNWAFLDCNPSLSSPMAVKWCTKLEVA